MGFQLADRFLKTLSLDVSDSVHILVNVFGLCKTWRCSLEVSSDSGVIHRAYKTSILIMNKFWLTQDMQSFLDTLRITKLRLLQLHYEANCGHLGGNFSCIDALMTLYHCVMRPNDRFVRSKGHSAGIGFRNTGAAMRQR